MTSLLLSVIAAVGLVAGGSSVATGTRSYQTLPMHDLVARHTSVAAVGKLQMVDHLAIGSSVQMGRGSNKLSSGHGVPAGYSLPIGNWWSGPGGLYALAQANRGSGGNPVSN